MKTTGLILIFLTLSSQFYGGWFFSKKKPVFIYGIEKTVYESMTEEQQKHVIDVFNDHEVATKQYQEKIAELQQQQEQLKGLASEKEALLTQIKQLEFKLESQEKAINNFLSVTQDLLEARTNKRNYREKYKRAKFFPKIASIKRGFNATTILLENGTLIEVSPFEKEVIDAWIVGQAVQIEKGEGLIYILNLTNLDTESSVSVKIKESP